MMSWLPVVVLLVSPARSAVTELNLRVRIAPIATGQGAVSAAALKSSTGVNLRLVASPRFQTYATMPEIRTFSAPAYSLATVAGAAIVPAGAKPALIATVAAALPDMSKMSGAESASAAESDFNARAQLGAPALSEGGAVAAASLPLPDSRGPLRLLPSAPRVSVKFTRDGNVIGLDRGDLQGGLMRAALRDLDARPAGAVLDLNFVPGPESLRELGAADGALLWRSGGHWRLTRAGASGFSAAPADADLIVAGRARTAPTPADLAATRGRKARVAIADAKGLLEWNSVLPESTPDDLDGSAGARLIARLARATGLYDRLLESRGVALARAPWERAADWLDAGVAPVGPAQMELALIPSWIKDEFPVTTARLGRATTPVYEAEVLQRSKVWVYKWHSRWTYEVRDGLPDGHFDPLFGIRVMLKGDWRKLKDPMNHFRVLWAHEYTHWLQDEGLVTRRYGGEPPAVAVELLRAVELVGVDGMKAGRIGIIHEGTLASFEDGREWARGSMEDATILMFRGTMGGAAYEVGRRAGRPEAAWEWLNLVMAEKGALSPKAAFERVTGARP